MAGSKDDVNNHYSEQHRRLLLWAARHARKYLYNRGVRVEIEDLVNVGWFKCLRKFNADELSGKSWFLVLTMTKYACPRSKSNPNLKHEYALTHAASDDSRRVDVVDEIMGLCSDLPANWLRVIKFRFFDGMTLGETGDVLGMSGERVRQIQCKFLKVARKRCAELYEASN